MSLASTSVCPLKVLSEVDSILGSKFEKDLENYTVEQLRRWLKYRGLKQSRK